VNPVANHIDMVSIPRDALVPNTALNNANDKLTHTGNDGIENSVETIQNFFGIPIDYYARVSFNSLIEIVDTIGGIDVDVEIDFCEQDENRSFKKEDLICLKKGKQHLNGKQALA
ncbi:TPA: LCP family protein, partial [Clostridioides difficile]